MKNRLISVIRRWPAALLSHLQPAAASPGVPAPCASLARSESVADTLLEGLGIAASLSAGSAASVGALFASSPHRSTRSKDALADEIRVRARAINESQRGCQPIYGFLDEFPGKRTAHLERSVGIVHDSLRDIGPKHQVRILDVGCNCGYVTLRLAETFPSVVGLDISRRDLQLCRLLAAHAGSPARFYADDVLAIADSEQGDMENADVVLLYNVVHQFIFHHGLEKTKALLARLASGVDTVIVELALKADYVRHGKQHLFPENPEDVLTDCTDVEIEKLHDQPRPVYRLRRKVVRIGPLEIRPERIVYSHHPNALVSRKYYTGGGRFLKLFRFTQRQGPKSTEREVQALKALQHAKVVPRLLGHVVGRNSGAVLMSDVGGEPLGRRLQHPTRHQITPAVRMRLSGQYLEIAKTVHDAFGYHNDLQLHNLLASKDGSLMLVDFEQAAAEPTNDPFGLLLWSLFDLWGGRDNNRSTAIRNLRLAKRGLLPAGDHLYPDYSALKLPPQVRGLVEAAAKGGDWGAFLDEWLPVMRAAESGNDGSPASSSPAAGCGAQRGE
jgi:SAM-dependent methyltransferase